MTVYAHLFHHDLLLFMYFYVMILCDLSYRILQSSTLHITELDTCGKVQRVVQCYIGKPVALVALLYFFICSLDVLSSSFRLLGGKTVGESMLWFKSALFWFSWDWGVMNELVTLCHCVALRKYLGATMLDKNCCDSFVIFITNIDNYIHDLYK